MLWTRNDNDMNGYDGNHYDECGNGDKEGNDDGDDSGGKTDHGIDHENDNSTPQNKEEQ